MTATLRLALLTAASLMAAAGTFPAKAQGTDARLEAFREACVPGARNFPKTEAAVAAAGWTPVAEDADPDLAALMKVGRELADFDDEIRLSGQSLYARTIDGTTFYIVTTYITSDYGNSVSCQFYHFRSETMVDPVLISGWLGEGPITAINEPARVIGQEWENARNLQGVQVSQTLAPKGSEVAEMAGFTGVSLAINGFEPD